MITKIVKPILFVFALVAAVGCQKAKWTYDLGTDGTTALSSAGDLEQTRGAIRKVCANTTLHETMAAPMRFPRPTNVCEWNANGNLGVRDLHFQARREQVATVTLPDGAIVCGMEFDFPQQPLYYDDEFLFTFNGKVLASSYNFENLFAKTGPLLNYDWSRMVGLPWSAVTTSPYCAGEADGLARCDFPVTSTNGTISLSYDSSIIQEVFAQSPKTGAHELHWITTGDNDTQIDCLHSAIDATIRITYIRGQ